MSDLEPIRFRPRATRAAIAPTGAMPQTDGSPRARFDRSELSAILDLYGRKVASGDWRDYAIDLLRDKAVFSVFRRASECPLYRIEKEPRLARKQGAYSVVGPGGLVMKRGHDLRRVLGVLEGRLELISS